MTRRHTTFLALVLALLTGFALPAQGQATVTVKMATLVPENSSWFLVLKEVANDWGKISNGKVRVLLYPGGRQGDDPDVVRKMNLGTLNAGVLTSAGLGEVERGVYALSIPMAFADYEEAYAVLEHALVSRKQSRENILQQLIGLRDDKAVPLLCYVLNQATPSGKMVEVHAHIIEALGGLAPHAESTRTLRTILHRGEWWAPFRTKLLRLAAASALRRIASAETMAVLEDAARNGSRSVRAIAKPHLGGMPRRERERA